MDAYIRNAILINMNKNNKQSSIDISIFGVVQGVGFRPFIYSLANKYQYNGWVKNMGFGVDIHLETNHSTDFQGFIKELQKNQPPLSKIEHISTKASRFQNYKDFSIVKTRQGKSFVFISPDISICNDCLKEMMTPSDRRYQYPFINCTNCGPRYSIVKSLPYDREHTTMHPFKMCEECKKEYENPLDRRYHAQPVACFSCGPEISLTDSQTGKQISGGIKKASSLLKKGKIIAVKGLGGFHLICDAFNHKTVSRLRNIKQRKRKPFALMARSMEIIKKYSYVSTMEENKLSDPRRPIVLLKKKEDIKDIAPHIKEFGFMLPYTPIHYLLMQEIDLIVATSSNTKDAPIMNKEEEGIFNLCDFVLSHNREIEMRADDSVLKVVDQEPLFLRRARGYVPYPQKVPEALESSQHILALGGELKDTISVYKNGYVITSQFLGDLDEYRNYTYFEETINHLTNLFDIKPKIIVCDAHPEFHSTDYAKKSGLTFFQIQHHFAHTLSVLLEHKFPVQKKVLGISFDGYGYGEDGTGWGGEFLLANYTSFERFAHFSPVPLPGGDLAAKQPWRMAVSYLIEAFGFNFPEIKSLNKISSKLIKGIINMIRENFNSPLVSSCGRLFDAISFLTGLAPAQIEYEAEAPMRLESIASEKIKEAYGFSLKKNKNPIQVSFVPTIREVVEDIKHNTPISIMSAKFHNTIACVMVFMAEKVREEHHIDTIALSGGVFLNKKLLSTSQKLLKEKGFKVLRSINYSPNDESVSLGQIAFALNKLR